MTAAELLTKYVDEWGWLSVGNIYSDNGSTYYPFNTDGAICYSESSECIFTINKIDSFNSSIFETRYAVAPVGSVGFQQTISVMPFEHIQRWDALLYAHMEQYEHLIDLEDFPVPTRVKPADILAIVVDPETHIAAGYPKLVMTDLREESVIDMYPDKEYPDHQFNGMRIVNTQNFYKNHEKFCTAMYSFFGVSDCK